jgi:hypothetical protein
MHAVSPAKSLKIRKNEGGTLPAHLEAMRDQVALAHEQLTLEIMKIGTFLEKLAGVRQGETPLTKAGLAAAPASTVTDWADEAQLEPVGQESLYAWLFDGLLVIVRVRTFKRASAGTLWN